MKQSPLLFLSVFLLSTIVSSETIPEPQAVSYNCSVTNHLDDFNAAGDNRVDDIEVELEAGPTNFVFPKNKRYGFLNLTQVAESEEKTLKLFGKYHYSLRVMKRKSDKDLYTDQLHFSGGTLMNLDEVFQFGAKGIEEVKDNLYMVQCRKVSQ